MKKIIHEAATPDYEHTLTQNGRAAKAYDINYKEVI